MGLPDVPLLLRRTAFTVSVALAQVVSASVYAYVPPRKYTVSPGIATDCAFAQLANGAASVPAAESLPVGDT
jgi:hypothetical protein